MQQDRKQRRHAAGQEKEKKTRSRTGSREDDTQRDRKQRRHTEGQEAEKKTCSRTRSREEDIQQDRKERRRHVKRPKSSVTVTSVGPDSPTNTSSLYNPGLMHWTDTDCHLELVEPLISRQQS